MPRIIELTGEEFKSKLQGEFSFSLPSEHRWASVNAKANGYTIPWSIPSTRYYNSFPIPPDMIDPNDRERPDYLITSRVELGGKCVFNQETTASNYEYFEYPCEVNITHCKFTENITVSYLKSKSLLHFHKCTFERGISISGSEINNIRFSDCSFNNRQCGINSTKTSDLRFVYCENIDYLSIESNNTTIINCIYLSKTSLRVLSMTGLKFADLYLEDITCNELYHPADSILKCNSLAFR